MIAAVFVAVVLGVLACYSLIGRSTVEPGLASTFLLGLGALAVSGAGFSAITLPWAVGMALAVGVGLLLAPRVLASPRGPFAAAVSMTVGLVMAAGIVRWLVPIAADLASLSSWTLALAVIAAAATWAVGQKGTWLRTAFWVSIVTAVLFLLAGLALGAPATLTSPLVETDINMTTGIVWLIAVAYFSMLHPSPPRSAAGVLAVAGALLFGLIGLLSLLAGVMFFPNTGLFTVVGYASIGTGLPGAVLAALTLVVATVALGLMMRVTLAPWQGFEAPFRRLNHPGWRVSVVAGLVGLLSFDPVPMWVLVGLSVVFGVAAMIADRREIHVRVG